MKEYTNIKTNDLTQSLISQNSNKNNQNYSISSNNCFSDDAIPGNISEKEKAEINSKNKLYFYQYSKLFDENILLKLKLQELICKRDEYKKVINKLEIKDNINKEEFYEGGFNNIPNNLYINNRRKRRKRCQINYKYECNFKNCNKKYSAEGCLNQHIKLKHG